MFGLFRTVLLCKFVPMLWCLAFRITFINRFFIVILFNFFNLSFFIISPRIHLRLIDFWIKIVSSAFILKILVSCYLCSKSLLSFHKLFDCNWSLYSITQLVHYFIIHLQRFLNSIVFLYTQHILSIEKKIWVLTLSLKTPNLSLSAERKSRNFEEFWEKVSKISDLSLDQIFLSEASTFSQNQHFFSVLSLKKNHILSEWVQKKFFFSSFSQNTSTFSQNKLHSLNEKMYQLLQEVVK